MSESNVKTGGKNMNRWIAVSAIGILLVVLVVVIVVFNGKVGNLNDDLKASEAQVATLQSQVNGLQSERTDLQGKLTSSQNNLTSRDASLATANTQIAALKTDVDSKQGTITAQAAEIKKMKYPKHFNTIDELANWLQKDNTNTLFANPSAIQKAQLAFVLQIRAAREGYFLSTNMPVAGNLDLIVNRALVGDVIYEIRAWDDFTQRWGTVSPAMPSYPILPDSGQ